MARRGKGEGSIRKRADGRWEGVVTLPSGKRKSVYGKTRKECSERLDQLRQQVGVIDLDVDQDVAEYLSEWLDGTVRRTCKQRTQKSYADQCRLHIIPHIGHIKLKKLTVRHVNALVSTLEKKNISNRTIEYTISVLSRALNAAVRQELIVKNVAALADTPRAEKHRAVALSTEQARQLLEAVAGHRLEVLYRIALSLGLRRGELIVLTWSDIDLERGLLTINEGKTDASARTLALPKVLCEYLHSHRIRQIEERLAMGPEWADHNLVFPSEVGTPLNPTNLWRHFKIALKHAGLPDMRFHDLRHSCATFLVAQGVHPRVAMQILGHSKISTTMDIYAHVSDDDQRSAVDKVASDVL